MAENENRHLEQSSHVLGILRDVSSAVTLGISSISAIVGVVKVIEHVPAAQNFTDAKKGLLTAAAAYCILDLSARGVMTPVGARIDRFLTGIDSNERLANTETQLDKAPEEQATAIERTAPETLWSGPEWRS